VRNDYVFTMSPTRAWEGDICFNACTTQDSYLDHSRLIKFVPFGFKGGQGRPRNGTTQMCSRKGSYEDVSGTPSWAVTGGLTILGD
jgi:hypothetical protein